jgi:hypothetical protein
MISIYLCFDSRKSVRAISVYLSKKKLPDNFNLPALAPRKSVRMISIYLSKKKRPDNFNLPALARKSVRMISITGKLKSSGRFFWGQNYNKFK